MSAWDTIWSTIVGGLILAFLCWFAKYMYGKIKEDPPVMVEGALFLSSKSRINATPCIGRERILDETFNKIRTSHGYTGIKLIVTGHESMGKTLFCMNLARKVMGDKVYIGWCDYKENRSVFDLIATQFCDPRFAGKSKEKIIKSFIDLNAHCVLFVDNVDNSIDASGIEILANISNVTIVMNGNIKRVDLPYLVEVKLWPLKVKALKTIFWENLNRDRKTVFRKGDEDSIYRLLSVNAYGNPGLVVHYVSACLTEYKGNWKALLHDVERLSATVQDAIDNDDGSYIRKILKEIYHFGYISDEQKAVLEKLSVFSYQTFTSSFFHWFLIDKKDICALCNTNWLSKMNGELYSIDEIHHAVIRKIFYGGSATLSLIKAATKYHQKYPSQLSISFEWFASYAEDILNSVKSRNLHGEGAFREFVLIIAKQYHFNLRNPQLAHIWLNSYSSNTKKGEFDFDQLLFSVSIILNDCPRDEVDRLYLNARISAENAYKAPDDYIDKIRYLETEYILYMNHIGEHEDARDICLKFFEEFDPDYTFDPSYSCFYYNRLVGTYDDLIKQSGSERQNFFTIATDDIIYRLLQQDGNEVGSACIALCRLFKKMNEHEKYEKCKRKAMIILSNAHGFCNQSLFSNIQSLEPGFTKMDFVECCHTDPELFSVLENLLELGDTEAHYLEARYQEERKNDNAAAITHYELSAVNGSLQAIHELGMIYFTGRCIAQDLENAEIYFRHGSSLGYEESAKKLEEVLELQKQRRIKAAHRRDSVTT